MNELILLTLLVALAASAGGLISMFTKKEMEQYEKWIKISELILAAILAVFMITFQGLFSILPLITGAVFVMIINRLYPHIHLSRYLRMLMFGLGLGLLFKISRPTAFLFGAICVFHNIVKGSRVGEYFFHRRKNIFKMIGTFQAIFILASIASFYFVNTPFAQASILNFAAGAVIATVLGTKL